MACNRTQTTWQLIAKDKVGEQHILRKYCNCNSYIPRRKSGIYWIQVRRAAAAAAAAVEISLWTR